jgi:hypothetical protein
VLLEQSMVSMALDAGEPQPSGVCGSKARAVAPDDGGGTYLTVGGC